VIDEQPTEPYDHGPYAPPGSRQLEVQAKRQSGMGIASFVISLLCGAGMLATFAYAGYVEATTAGGMQDTSPVAIMIGMAMLLIAGLLVVGLGLGIGGLFQPDRRKVFAVLGAVFNGLVLLGGVTLVAIGLAMDA
jgi:hypothetical protein